MLKECNSDCHSSLSHFAENHGFLQFNFGNKYFTFTIVWKWRPDGKTGASDQIYLGITIPNIASDANNFQTCSFTRRKNRRGTISISLFRQWKIGRRILANGTFSIITKIFMRLKGSCIMFGKQARRQWACALEPPTPAEFFWSISKGGGGIKGKVGKIEKFTNFNRFH